MLRVVVDPGVLIAALISPTGAPAEVIRRWVAGEFQLVYSSALMEEFIAVVDRPKFRPWFSVEQGRQFAAFVQTAAEMSDDRATGSARPPDPGDAYLVDLVVFSGARAVITGDGALAAHRTTGFSALSPRDFLDLLARMRRSQGFLDGGE